MLEPQSPSTEIAESPKRKAADLFGGREELVQSIVRKLRTLKTVPAGDTEIIDISQQLSLAETDPKELFSQLTRQQLIDWLFLNDISLDVVVPLTWEGREQEYDWWKAEFERRGSRMFNVVTTDNVQGAEHFFVTLCTQMEALEEICAERDKYSTYRALRLELLRKKYREVFRDEPARPFQWEIKFADKY
jgi:hypothetical protein